MSPKCFFFFLSSAAIPNWPVSEIHTDCPARLAATPKLPRKLCSHHPEGLHWLKLELPSVKDFFLYPDGLFSMVLLPHRRVAQRQDPPTRKCLDIQFYDMFLAGQQLLADSVGKVAAGAPDQFTWKSSVSLAEFFGACFPLRLEPPPPPLPFPCLPFGGTTRRGKTTTQLCFAEDRQILMNRAGWSELLHHPSTSLRVNLPRAIRTDGYTTQINLKNTV